MNICVLGTGVVGQTIAGKLAQVGHKVVVGTRDVAQTMSRTEPGPTGSPPYSVWQGQNPGVKLATYAESARHGEVVFNATNGIGSMEALNLAGGDNLKDKIILDISNPLDFSRGMPPTLWVSNSDSLGEQLQRAFPAAKVVKTLNTVTASLMVDPHQLAGGEHHIFVSGDDAGAKAQVAAWLKEWFGWKHVLDLGDITTARGAEMYLPLWLRLWGAVGTPMLNVKVVTP